MNPLLLGPLADIIKGVVGRLWPDPAQQADAQLKLAQLVQTGELARMANDSSLMLAQIGVNNTEAASENLFKSGWRPFLGWMCGVSLAYAWLATPILVWLSQNAGWHVPPTLSATEQMTIVGQMMGLAGARTVEKLNGAQ